MKVRNSSQIKLMIHRISLIVGGVVFLFADNASAVGQGLLSGAFIQFDDNNRNWDQDKWRKVLGQMQDVGMQTIIVQYLQKRDCDVPETQENYVPDQHGESDPVATILEYADCHQGMTVFIGLRFDERLMRFEFLNDPAKLRSGGEDELVLNTKLIETVTCRYLLKGRQSFAGWYLPVEVANYKEDQCLDEKDRWINQLNGQTHDLVKACHQAVEKPVAVSPYFNARTINGVFPAYLMSAEQMGRDYARLLAGTGVSIVMLQDGIGVGRIPLKNVPGYVSPFLASIEQACRKASPPTGNIEFWLNVESIGADIDRLQVQMGMGQGRVKKIVAFDFPHHMYDSPLYDDYKCLIAKQVCP